MELQFPVSGITSSEVTQLLYYWQQLAGAVSSSQSLLRWDMSAVGCHSACKSLLYLDTEASCSFFHFPGACAFVLKPNHLNHLCYLSLLFVGV